MPSAPRLRLSSGDHHAFSSRRGCGRHLGCGVCSSGRQQPATVASGHLLSGRHGAAKQYTNYSVSFLASDATTNLSFSFREDPAFFSIDNIVLTSVGGSNLIVNGDFEQGPVGSSTPTGWSYLNLYNANAAGVVRSGCGTGGSNCYYDGAVGSYDSITQAVATTVGTLYTLSFDLADNSNQAIGSAIQSGNQAGINLVVYAGALPTAAAVPEPATWGMMIVGFGVVGAAARRRRSVSAVAY